MPQIAQLHCLSNNPTVALHPWLPYIVYLQLWLSVTRTQQPASYALHAKKTDLFQLKLYFENWIQHAFTIFFFFLFKSEGPTPRYFKLRTTPLRVALLLMVFFEHFLWTETGRLIGHRHLLGALLLWNLFNEVNAGTALGWPSISCAHFPCHIAVVRCSQFN